MSEKAARWERWIDNMVLPDIADPETPDPVPFFEETPDGLETSDALGSYKWGKNDGEYLYLVYLLAGSGTEPSDVIPVYVGESVDVSTRLGQHSRKIRDALPLSSWADDGSWGSFSKYHHIAAVAEAASSPLYVWLQDLEDDATGPYGHDTYRQELEAKLVGLVHSQDRFDRVFANREFVPNSRLHELGKVGPEWVDVDEQPPDFDDDADVARLDATGSKADRWYEWVEGSILADVQDPAMPDPIPLFDTDETGRVRLTDSDRLARSAAIDERIRAAGRECVDRKGLCEDGGDGLLYVLYQLAAAPVEAEATHVVPRYIGKAEASGKKRALSANFTEIAHGRDGTRSFARWGGGDYWHVGELSMALFGDDDRKAHWVDALFEDGTRRLADPTYLWVTPWEDDVDVGPYGTPATLAEVEALLIGLAYDAAPETLLNQDGIPDRDSD